MMDIKELEAAFIKADDLAVKGDAQAADDAKAFAAEIRKLQAGSAKPQASLQATPDFEREAAAMVQDSPGKTAAQVFRQLGLTARAGIEGIGNVAQIGTEPIRMALNAAARGVAGPTAPRSEPTGQMASQLADAIGLPSPNAGTEKLANVVSSGMAGAGGMGMLGRAAASVPGLLGDAGRFISNSLGSQVTASGAGAAGGELARDAGVGPVGQIAASVGASLVPGAGQVAASRVVNPNVNPHVRTMMNEGVTPTLGRLVGGRGPAIEDKLMSSAILGDAITNAKQAGFENLNRALYRRALDPIGVDASRLPIGREGVEAVKNALSRTYDELLPRMQVRIDAPFVRDVSRISNDANLIAPRQQQFNNIIEQQLVTKLGNNPTGEQLKEVESVLRQQASNFRSSADADSRNLGRALDDVRTGLREMLMRSNPEHARELQAINTGYANYARLRDAASRIGSHDGIVTPGALASAVRKGDNSVGKGAYSEGRALMEDLSDAATHVLGSKYPDSGTMGRANMLKLFEGGVFSPLTIPATIPYLPFVREGLAGAMASRPAGAATIADMLRPDSSALQRSVLSEILRSSNGH